MIEIKNKKNLKEYINRQKMKIIKKKTKIDKTPNIPKIPKSNLKLMKI